MWRFSRLDIYFAYAYDFFKRENNEEKEGQNNNNNNQPNQTKT
jgi:hypothetical protein